MDYTIPDQHFENLRHSAQDLFGMGLEVVPAMEMVIDREDYLGYADFDEWRENHFPELWYPEQLGWEGREIIGSWNVDQSLYSGFFPVKITSDGESKVTIKSTSLTEEEVIEQIEAAKEHRILLGIAARPKFSATNFLFPNSLIYASKETFTNLRGERDNLRIETDGSSYWTYASTCFDHREIKKHFVGKNNKLFMLHGGDVPVGRIQKGFFKPCYPSIVFGEQIQTLDQSTKHKPLMILPGSLAKVNLEFDDDLYDWDEAEIIGDEESDRDDTGWLDEDEEEDYVEEYDPNPDWVVDPNDDEALFMQAVSQFERSTGLNKSIIRHGAASASIHSQHQEIKPEELSEEKNTPSECTKNVAALPASDLSPSEVVLESVHCWLEELFPPDLANACRVITENLPYDERSVSLAYLTCIASLLKLGTKINGNSLTKYVVPMNLYTAFIGKSGSKKTPLKGLMFDDPASPILLEIDRQNTRALVDWEEKCRGLKKDDKPPRPIPLKLRTQDYSSEALVSCLQKSDEHGRSFGIVRDELNALFKNMNRYAKGQGGDEEQLLELYDGKPFDSSRITNSRSYQRCSVTIYGNLQPSVFAELTKSKDATGQWARFLFVPLPEKTVPLPVECSEDSKRKLQEATTILEEYAIQAFNLNPQEYVLDEEARRIFSAYEHEKQQGVHASACETQSALHGKSASKVLRITGLVHVLLAIHSKKFETTSVNSETLMRAIALVDDLDHWALSQYAKRDAAWTSKITNEMRRLHNLAFLQKGPVTWIILKDKLSSKETKVINRVKADELFRLLEAMGYGRIDSGPRGGLRYEALMELPPE